MKHAITNSGASQWRGVEFAEKVALWAILVIFTARIFTFTAETAHFTHDDYDHLVKAHEFALMDFIMSPIDLHFVPFHKLLSYVIAQSPLPYYGYAALFTSVMHLVICYMLYLLLHQLSPGRHVLYVVVFFGVSRTLIDQQAWWSSSAHRMPYVLLSIMSVYFYVLYYKGKSHFFGALAFLTFVLIFGFYSKAIIVPLLIASVLYSLDSKKGMLDLFRRQYWLFAMFLVSFLYVLHFKLTAGQEANVTPPVHYIVDIVVLSFMETLKGFSPDLITLKPYLIDQVAIFISLSLILWFLASSEKNVRVMAALFLCLLVNFLVIAASQRGIWGGILAFSHRYYYEVNFILAMFLVMAIGNSLSGVKAVNRVSFPAAQVAWCIMLVFSLVYYESALNSFERDYGEVTRKVDAYLGKLDASVKALDGASIVIRNDYAEEYMRKLFDAPLYKSQVIGLLYPSLEFGEADKATHFIEFDGSIKPL